MKFRVYEVAYQLYLLPYVKVTYHRNLNDNYELIVGWFNIELVLSF